MKHIKLAAAAAFVVGLTAAGSASAVTGVVRFVGEVADQTCVVTGGENAETGGPNKLLVKLDPVTVASLANAGDTAGRQNFGLKFSNGEDGSSCTTIGLSGATFQYLSNSQALDTLTGNLKNTELGGAKNVQLQLLTEAGTVIDLRNHTPDAITFTPAGPTEKVYGVQYVSTGATTAGGVTSHVLFEVIYN